MIGLLSKKEKGGISSGPLSCEVTIWNLNQVNECLSVDGINYINIIRFGWKEGSKSVICQSSSTQLLD